MSYILEAIKKAESERGKPLLQTKPVQVNANDEKPARSISWLAVAVFLNAMILLAWIVTQQLNNANNDEQVEQTQNEVITNIKQDQDGLNSDASDNNQMLTQEIDASSVEDVIDNEDLDVPSLEKVPSEEVISTESKGDIPSFFSTPDDTSFESIPEISEPEITRHSEESETDQKNKQQIINIEPQNLPKAEVDPLPKVYQDTKPALLAITPSEEVEVIDVPVKIETPIIENPDAPEFGQLPYSLQKQIPKLQISVHIYNVQKDLRKVRVNGGLLLEGQQVEDDLIVLEITPRGVVFDYDGTIFKMNLR
jgi:hypothetical protein